MSAQDTIRFWIDPDGVIRWREKGWPGNTMCDYEQPTTPEQEEQYFDEMARAKAESVPVRDGYEIWKVITGKMDYDCKKRNDAFYDVPANEIKKEWL